MDDIYVLGRLGMDMCPQGCLSDIRSIVQMGLCRVNIGGLDGTL